MPPAPTSDRLRAHFGILNMAGIRSMDKNHALAVDSHTHPPAIDCGLGALTCTNCHYARLGRAHHRVRHVSPREPRGVLLVDSNTQRAVQLVTLIRKRISVMYLPIV